MQDSVVVPQRRIPFVQQMEAVECGAASLTMVLGAFGHYAPLSEVRAACGVSRDGVSAKAIVKAARRYGLKTKPRRLEPEDLVGLKGPTILHWEMNHFVVFVRSDGRLIWINDPAIGPRKIAAEDFDKSFTGICLQFSPGDDFERRPNARPSLSRYRSLIRQSGEALVSLLGLAALINIIGLAVPMATQLVIDRVMGLHQYGWLGAIAGGGLTLLAGLAAIEVGRGRLLTQLQAFVDDSQGTRLVSHLLRLPVPFFHQRHAADMVMRVQSISALRDIIAGQGLAALVDLPLATLYAAILFAYHPWLATTGLVGAALYVAIFFGTLPARRHATREQLARDVHQQVELTQALKGVVALKSAGREDTAYSRWVQRFVPALDSGARRADLDNRTAALLGLVRSGTPAIVLIFGARYVVEGQLGLGALIGFLLLLAAFFGPLERVIQTLLGLQSAPTHLARMDDVLSQHPERSGADPCPQIRGEVAFEDVTFRYGPDAPLVLDGMSFSIRRGQKVAFVGASGSGKSTIARLLLGFYSPTSGSIRVDGLDLSTLSLTEVRRQVGTVLQEATAFPGSIRDNIAMFDPSVPDEDIIAAARVAQLHADILRLPGAYGTTLSTGGAPLSGGQLQRLALARAVVNRPPILVLDEATSALDAVTEAAVERYLRERQCTRLVIAHRLSTVRDADCIMVVDGGAIVEQGTHEALVARGGVYATLVASGEREAEQPAAITHGRQFDSSRWEPLAGLSDLLAENPTRLLRRERFEPGDTIVQQGERTRGLCLLESGEAELVLEEPGLDPYPLAPLEAGDLFGEASLLDGLPSPASAIARTEVHAWVLPAQQFDELRNLGDALALELSLALGAEVAKGIVFLTERRREVGHGGGYEHEFINPQTHFKELDLAATPLGAALTEDELGFLGRIGEARPFAAGELLFQQGDHADTTMLVLSGRIGVVLKDVEGYMNVVRPGEIVGEVGLFGAQTRSAGCVAIDPVQAFAIHHDALRRLLKSGDEIAWKVLRHLIHNLVDVYRTSVRRLREAVAMVRKERAGDPASVLDRPEREVGTPEHVQVVSHCAAACLRIVLSSFGREVPLGVLVEASLDGHQVTPDSLVEAAGSFGLALRRVRLPTDSVRLIDRPLLLERRPGHFLLAEPRARGAVRVFDPLSGWSVKPLAELTGEGVGVAFEVSRDQLTGSLARRAWAALTVRKGALASLVAATAFLQSSVFIVPLALSWIAEYAIPHADLPLVDLIGVGVAIAVLASAWLRWFRGRALTYLRTRIDDELAGQLLRHAMRLPVSYFERHSPGDVLERFHGFALVRTLLGTRGVAIALDLPTLVVSLVVMRFVDRELFVVILVGTMAYLALSAAVVVRGARLARREVEASADNREQLLAMVRGIATLRTSSRSDGVFRRWLSTYHGLLSVVASQSNLRTVHNAAVRFVASATVLAVVLWGAFRHARGAMDVAAVLAFVTLAGYYFTPLRAVGDLAMDLVRVGRRIGLVRDLLAETPEQSGALNRPGRVRGRVSLEHVDFRYREDGPLILRDVSLEIPAGSKVALVGPSGSGKSTLGRLLLGLYAPTVGRVLVDGRDLSSTDLRSVRRQVGVVMQNPFIFSGSIRDNIAIGAAGSQMPLVREAAQQAMVDDLIDSLPMRYETVLCEGGGTFSGGQRQRLAIARALVGRPAMLLLDEATSAIDNVSQAAIEENLRELRCTRVVIAHRLSTVVDADKIVVLDHGRIVEEGTYEELVAARGLFHRLVGAQLG